MLGLVAGRLRRLARSVDASGRPLAVWALPGAVPSDGALTLRALQQVIPSWGNLTGQWLQEVGKLDVVIWSGQSPWSTSQVGLLWLDRFRALWNPMVRCAAMLSRRQCGWCKGIIDVARECASRHSGQACVLQRAVCAAAMPRIVWYPSAFLKWPRSQADADLRMVVGMQHSIGLDAGSACGVP